MPSSASTLPARSPRRRAVRIGERLGEHGTGLVGAGAWVALVAAGGLIAHAIDSRRQLLLDAPPLSGRFDPTLDWHVLPALALAGLAVAAGPALAARLRWHALLAATGATAFAWAWLLAATRGWSAITRPLRSQYDYLVDVPLVRSPGDLLSHITFQLSHHVGPHYATHVRGHPPGMLVLLWLLDRIGLGGAWPEAVLVIAGGAVGLVTTLVAVRALAGEAVARAAAPFLALAPAALWIGTSADALYLGVSASGIALLVLAAVRRHGRRADALALAGGVLLGLGLMLSYGLGPAVAVALLVLLLTRRVRLALVAAGGVLLVLLALRGLGFDWLTGLRTTRTIALAGVQSSRPYLAFILISPAAFALALGPATAAGLARLRDRRLWLLAGGALAALVLSDLSGISRGETERIWLPFAPWLLVATAALATRAPRHAQAGGTRVLGAPRGWLAAQVACAFAVELIVSTSW